MLVEGSSMRSISRVLGISFNTVKKLLVDAGRVCLWYHDIAVRDVRARYVECDEIWAFCYSKERNAAQAKGVIDWAGDVWTWTGMDRDSKLMISWLVGNRSSAYAKEFMKDLESRLANRVQLTTDGHIAYPEAVDHAFGGYVDYATLTKTYGGRGLPAHPERRYSPAGVSFISKQRMVGKPVMSEASTSRVERQNLTIRMSQRRFTRLTNAFSKKVDNHRHSMALFCVWYNFCRPHMSLKGSTPAEAAGLIQYPRDMRWIVELMDYMAPVPKRR